MDSKNLFFKFSNSIAWQLEKTEDFIYILEYKNNEWHYLKDIAKEVWLLIAQEFSLNDIVTHISDKYKVDYSMVYDDIRNLTSDLSQKELILSYGK